MKYEPKNFDHLFGLKLISDETLKNHFALYQGYVANTNKFLEILAVLESEGKTQAPEYAELKRRFGWEFNGMRLHEYYFGAMKRDGNVLEQNAELFTRLEKDFGSYKDWEKSFKAAGLMRGIGWAILYFDPKAERLFNVWVNEHDFGHLAGAAPILVMDVFEHAYFLDYGLKRADYIEAFFKVIDWEAAVNNFDRLGK